MADALKAEGNKLFAAKDFAGAMYVFNSISLDSSQEPSSGEFKWRSTVRGKLT